ncbi:unnamed protein product [Effrenium voratum]|uniref:Uncharacterized protein n=1 Tax=Effrenium voratum TaxID=2562239 RepID=A0AA36HKZ0_9DINO|nr:unnamed protein product [Effrenium voratum]
MGAMAFCTITAFEITESGFEAVGPCCFSCAALFRYALPDPKESRELQTAVQAASPALLRYQLSGVVYRSGDWRDVAGLCCFALWLPLVSVACPVAVAVAHFDNGFLVAAVILWVPMAAYACLFYGGVSCGCLGNQTWHDRAEVALSAIVSWPEWVLKKCSGKGWAFWLQPSKEVLDEAILLTHQHTIVFEGSVLLPQHGHLMAWQARLGLLGGRRSSRST